MITQTLGHDQHGQPTLLITVTGWHDIFRLHYNLIGAQIEISALARKAFVWMRKTMGVKQFTALDQTLTGGIATRERWTRVVED